MLDVKKELYQLSIQHWLDYEFLTWKWFAKVFIIILFLFIFYKFVHRARLLEIMSYGFLVSLISTVLDIIGTYFVFWEYPLRVLPLEFSEIHDLVVIPISYMLVYQFFTNWKSFVIANVILALIASFVMEPIFMMANFYQPTTWKHIYSFPIFFAIAVMSRYLILKLRHD